MSLSNLDENLVQTIPNLRKRIDYLENIGNVNQVTIYDALNDTGNIIPSNTPVNIRNDGGFLVFVKASNINRIPCNAFALEEVSPNSVGKIVIDGVLQMSGLVPGKKYYLGNGIILDYIEQGPNYFVQMIGRAYSTTIFEIDFGGIIQLR